MRKAVFFLLAAVCCPLAFGQLDSNSITVTATNNVALQPDQAVFAVSVTSPLTAGLDDVLAALAGSGITAANFSGVSTQSTISIIGNPGLLPGTLPAPMLTWTFTLTGPLANTKATVASLTTLEQNIAKGKNGLALSFSIAGTQVSQQLAQSQTCSYSDLVASATTQAQALATAGGVTLGSILALSSATGNVASGPGYVNLVGFVLPNAASAPCAITVKFAAIHH
ncbi:MAG TPA: SIMPL domain-containing protein [Bryobacteraceae bacterium]|nr:SIMPL domain-containing protein [Bryobacteraceae bacterium]